MRSETEIGQSAVSVSYAAVELAREIFGSLAGKKVMIVGAGKMSELAARHLHRSGASQIFVTNRTHERAVEMAELFRGTVVEYDRFIATLPEMDIVITSSGAPHYILHKEEMKRVIEARRNRPMFLIDIAVPRNIEPSVNDLDNVFLYDIDDLQKVVDANRQGRLQQAEQAEQIIAEEVERMMARLKAREVTPTIVRLQEQLEQMRLAELERVRAPAGPADAAAGGGAGGADARHHQQDRARSHRRTAQARRRARRRADRRADPPGLPAGGMMLIIGSRGSQLALWQARWVEGRLEEMGESCRIEIIKTTGDKITDVPLAKVGTQGPVHQGDRRGAACGAHRPGRPQHEGPADAAARGPHAGRRSRARRPARRPGRTQAGRSGRPAARWEPVRCAAPRSCGRCGRTWWSNRCAATWTRGCASWTKGRYDAIVLAAAGLKRLGWDDRIAEILSTNYMCPAVGQGALAIETRADGGAGRRSARKLDHPDTRAAVTAERALLAALGGGCQVPIGAYATLDGWTVESDRRGLHAGRRPAAPPQRVRAGGATAEELGRELAADPAGRGRGRDPGGRLWRLLSCPWPA